mgnify:CR=1 FL=1
MTNQPPISFLAYRVEPSFKDEPNGPHFDVISNDGRLEERLVSLAEAEMRCSNLNAAYVKGFNAVRTSPDVAVPALDRDVVRRIMRAHMHELRDCYGQGLRRDPNLAGTLSLAYAIDGQGRVVATNVARSTLADPAVAQCIAAAARRWSFPKPTGSLVQVTAPFTFTPG